MTSGNIAVIVLSTTAIIICLLIKFCSRERCVRYLSVILGAVAHLYHRCISCTTNAVSVTRRGLSRLRTSGRSATTAVCSAHQRCCHNCLHLCRDLLRRIGIHQGCGEGDLEVGGQVVQDTAAASAQTTASAPDYQAPSPPAMPVSQRAPAPVPRPSPSPGQQYGRQRRTPRRDTRRSNSRDRYTLDPTSAWVHTSPADPSVSPKVPSVSPTSALRSSIDGGGGGLNVTKQPHERRTDEHGKHRGEERCLYTREYEAQPKSRRHEEGVKAGGRRHEGGRGRDEARRNRETKSGTCVHPGAEKHERKTGVGEEATAETVGGKKNSRNYTNVITKDKLEEYLSQVARSYELDEEFERIPKKFNKAITVAVDHLNKHKNRYKNNLPYDDTRVVLQDPAEPPSTDYINASYIRSYKKSRAYIASQGPKDFGDDTVGDFWRMVWQNKTNVIVMIARLIEGGKVKVSQYWPVKLKEKVNYGQIAVMVKEVKELQDAVRRHMVVSCGAEQREVVQYQFMTWPDHDVPAMPFSFAQMVSDVCKWKRSGPMVVHCSAGVGRTGTMLLVLLLLDQVEGTGRADPAAALTTIRVGRPSLVENTMQYRFAHQVLYEVLFSEATSIPLHEYSDYVSRNSDNLALQFKKLKEMSTNVTYKWGESAAHATLNRSPHILPADGRQIYLQIIGGRGESQYVNAVRVTGVTQRDALIVTEHPMPHTLATAWRMAFERKVSAWLLLHQHPPGQEEYPAVLPDSDKVSMDHLNLTVESVNDNPAYTEVTVTVTSKGGLSHTVRLLQLHGWPANALLPDDPLRFLHVIEYLYDLRLKNPNSQSIVTCNDGCTASGVVAALDSIITRLRLNRTVDVYRAVQTILLDRPQFISSLEQYRFLYEAMDIYVKLILTKRSHVEEDKEAESMDMMN